MKWITRERPKIDRIACPWLIKNFVDEEAEFIYFPADQVREKAKELNAIPYDITGVEYTHDGEYCTFDTIIKSIILLIMHYMNWQSLYGVLIQTVLIK